MCRYAWDAVGTWPVRVVLLAFVAAALGHVFLIEQPGSARFGDMPRWRHFVEEVCYVAFTCKQMVACVGL